MINYLQGSSPMGTQNFLQQQAVTTRVPEEIRTHSAEQVALRNVEQAANAPQAKETDAEGGKGQSQGEGKEQGAGAEEKAMIPPPPSRFQLKVQENTERVNKTQQAVTQFFLSAATSAGTLERGQGESIRGQANRLSVDVVA